MRVFETIGKKWCAYLEDMRSSMEFLGEFVVSSIWLLFHPHRFRLRDSLLAFERSGCGGFVISVMMGFLLGVILAFESAASLRMFGVEVYVADLLAIGLFRELGPIVTAIILAGRTGSAFAAEIGTMKVNEELDALTTMGLPPIRFLVLPRIVAATLACPLLTIAAELAGLLGGAVVLDMMKVPNVVFWRHVCSSATVFTISVGLAKAALFGLLVGFIGCSSGMRTRGTADGVGVAATKAVVGGIVAVAVADGIIAVVCYIFSRG